MAKKRATGWPPPPEPLPVPVVDNHTHLESVATWVAPGWDAADPPVPDAEDAAPVALSAHLARAASVGVTRVVTVACDVDALRWTDAFLRDLDRGTDRGEASDVPGAGGGAQAAAGSLAGVGVLGAAAIHPNEAVLHAGVREIAPDGLDPAPEPRHRLSLEEAMDVVVDVVRSNPAFRAIGETGLDYFRAGPRGREVQRAAFRAHVALAKELGLPLQIHDRDAHADVVETLLADGAPERTVFHCFSGDVELARTCAEHGWYLSIAGPVTFRANDDLRAAVAAVPLELLLTETDAPYLTPQPDRGRPNSPYLMPGTLREIARVREESLERVCAVTSATAQAIYGPW